MSRFDYRQLSPDERRAMLDQLCEAIVTLEKKDQVKLFLQRLLTESEIVMLMRRLQIAEFLISGLTYEQIKRKLGVSMSTIQSVDGWLTDAAHEYRLVREEKRRKAQEEVDMKRHAARKRQPHRESTVPGTLRHLARHDSRYILFRLLLGDL